MDVLLCPVEILSSIAATVKHGIKAIPTLKDLSTDRKFSILLTIACWIIAIMVFVILAIILAPLALYKMLIKRILQERHGEDFAGIFGPVDSLWVAEDETAYNIVNVAVIVEFNKAEDDLVKYFKNICAERLFKVKRLRSLRQFFMGYGYFLDNQVSIDDIVSTVKLSTTGRCGEKDLRKFMTKCANSPLPKNNTGCLEVIICEDRFYFDQGSNPEQYAILLRFHHSVGDGVSLMSMVANNVIDIKKSDVQEKLTNVKMSRKRMVEYFMQCLRKAYNCESYVNTLLASPDQNPLKTFSLSTQKNVGFKVEPEQYHTLEKVKAIKKAFNCTFSVVMYTAISASLSDFFNKNYPKQVPEDVTITFMVMPEREIFHYNHKEVKNVLCLANIKLPTKNVTFPETLLKIAEEHEKYANSCDSWICYWQMKTFCNFLPRSLVKSLAKTSAITTMGCTNLPGIKKSQIGGHNLNHLIFWPQNFVAIGVTLSIMTYDNRFQMGLVIDKNLIPEEDKVQELLEDIYAKIDEMYNTVNTKYV